MSAQYNYQYSESKPEPSPNTQTKNKHRTLKIIGCLTLIFLVIVGIVVVTIAYSILTAISEDYQQSTSNDKGKTNNQTAPEPTLSPQEMFVAKQRDEAGRDLFGLYNNFDYFYGLTSAQERRLGVLPLPEGSVRVTTIRGIGMYETPCRPFGDEEIALLSEFLFKLPRDFLDTQPKGIVSACLDQIGFSVGNLVTGVASGPYLYLGDEFFVGEVGNRQLTKNERIETFMHEYSHILQYYYVHQYWIDQDEPVMLYLEDTSSLIYDFAPRVGWYQETTSDVGPSFFTLDDGAWILRDDPESQNTTEYGKDGGPTEDFAESFGAVASGQPQIISQARRDYMLSLLGENETFFTSGVIPQYPGSQTVRFDVEQYFTKELSALAKEGKNVADRYQWSIEQPADFGGLVSYYTNELKTRGFNPRVPLQLSNGPLGKDEYAFGIYEYEDDAYAVILLGSKTIGSEITQGGSYTTTTYNQIVTPEYYLITALLYE